MAENKDSTNQAPEPVSEKVQQLLDVWREKRRIADEAFDAYRRQQFLESRVYGLLQQGHTFERDRYDCDWDERTSPEWSMDGIEIEYAADPVLYDQIRAVRMVDDLVEASEDMLTDRACWIRTRYTLRVPETQAQPS